MRYAQIKSGGKLHLSGRIFELCQPAYKHKDGNFYLEKEE